MSRSTLEVQGVGTLHTRLGEEAGITLTGMCECLSRGGSVDTAAVARGYSPWLSAAARLPLAMSAATDSGDPWIESCHYAIANSP